MVKTACLWYNDRMINNERIIESVFNVIDEINKTLPRAKRIDKSLEAVLFGTSSNIDSLGLTFLIVATERKIEKDFGILVRLTDERTMVLENSPFQTIKTLVDHISGLLNSNEGS